VPAQKKRVISVGDRFSRLVVQSFWSGTCENGWFVSWVKCNCDCGNQLDVRRSSLVCGETRSCGCLQRELQSARARTHAFSDTRIYRVWWGMVRRCRDQNEKSFRFYGARGISVCEAWNRDFVAFFDWAMANGYDHHLSLERVDCKGNYEPANCCWIPRNDQQKNTRRTRYITAFGETKCLSDWLKDPRCKASRSTIYGRLNCGYEGENLIIGVNLRYPSQPVSAPDRGPRRRPAGKNRTVDPATQ
jgi:hypothetical protein